ncbi:peptidoglycan DD-metalloendopeptidase family protein [Chlorobium sp. BLA1]|uniref:peptidoglycan DD-metalloendopeptidase family protein n=1 Tax=Candidatus Chlorobium masyuteum TaxID=2716876 RepID=UPI0014206564|nr:peptidoglycan DD-metalloendopeptidase family protein [Candidatus Chlorobium masyuteum]NHQ60685.1 peptidoglycan DD-metalloendopeptidase family protein [Candidatus Chlorobium masyuteum]
MSFMVSRAFFYSLLRRGACAFLLLLFSFPVMMSTASIAAPPVNSEIARIMAERSSVERTLRELKGQLKEYQFKLSSTRKQESLSLKSLENIRRQILVLEKMITENQNYLDRLNRDINRLQVELQGNRQIYGRVSDDFRRTAVSVYKYGGRRDVERLFASGSVNDAIVRAQYMGFFTRAVRRNVDDLQQAAVTLESNRVALEQTYRQKAAVVKEQENQLKTWARSKQEKEVVLVKLKQNKQEYAAQLEVVRKKRQQLQSRIESLIMAEQRAVEAENERRRKIIEARRLEARRLEARRVELNRLEADRQTLRRLQAERMAAKKRKGVAPPPLSEQPAVFIKDKKRPETPLPPVQERQSVPAQPEIASDVDRVSADFDNAAGSLPWPVRNGVVSQRFGSVQDRDLKIVTTNNGIDISVPSSTQVRAVSGGRVAQIAFLPTFGNIVIIRHSKSYLTVYANLGQLSVAKDDLIKSQQMVGLSGRMPEGGSVVHFEIWKGRVKQNPEKWLRR